MFSVRTPEYNEEISPNLNPQGKEGVKGDDYFLGLLPGIIGGKILHKKNNAVKTFYRKIFNRYL